MKILFISTAFPPFFESQTIRNAYFIKGLQKAGFEVIGVTSDTIHVDHSISMVLEAAVETIIIDEGWYVKFRKKLQKNRLNLLNRLLDILGPLIIVPDLNAGWGYKVVNNQYVNSVTPNCDLIITSSGSYEAHLAGKELSEKYNVPFLVEMGDPWAYNPIWPETFFIKKIFNKRLEKSVIKSANSIVFSTQETASFYKNLYQKSSINYIPMGFCKNDFSLQKPSTDVDEIKFSYVGVAYKGSRDITPLIDCISLEKTRKKSVNIYGKSSFSFQAYVKNNQYDFVKFYGQISYKESIKAIGASHVLIILGNDGELQIPGKSYIYLASGRPILYLARQSLNTDPTWNLLRKFSGVYGFPPSLDGLQNCIQDIMANYEKYLNDSSSRLNSKELSFFDWDKIGLDFANLAKKTIRE
jgi:hypothetical protein